MKIMVTGGGGFLGLELIKQLRDHFGDDAELVNISRNHHLELDQFQIQTIKCDISDKESVRALNFSDVDVIFHVAALAGVWGKRKDFFNVNYEGTRHVFDHAKKCGVSYFIYTSTPSVVFGKEDIILGDEKYTYPKIFTTYYAESKALAESYVLENSDDDMQAVALRPHLIWGQGDPHLIPRIIQKAKEGRLKLVGDGTNMVDIIYVKNAAKAHIQALNALRQGKKIGGEAYFIGQERPVLLWKFIAEILEAKNIHPIEGDISFKAAYWLGFFLEGLFKLFGIYKPEPPMTRFVAMQLAKNHYFSHEKARRDFDYHPSISIEEGFKETFTSKFPEQNF